MSEPRLPTSTSPKPASAQAPSRPLAYRDVLVQLGDLLASQGQPRPEAREHFEAALRLTPEHAEALAGLGALAEKKRPEEARQHYERAAALAPNDPMILYRYAKVLMQAGDAAATARQMLRRSIVAEPGFGPAWAQLSYANTFLDEPPEDAVAIAQRATMLLPGRWDVAMNLLYAYTRTDRRDLAQGMLERTFPVLEGGQHLPQARREVARADVYQVSVLAYEDRLDEAEALLEQVESDFTDVLDHQLRSELTRTRQYIDNHRAVTRYNAAVDRINAGDRTGGAEILRQLLAESQDSEVAEQARSLLEQLGQDPSQSTNPP